MTKNTGSLTKNAPGSRRCIITGSQLVRSVSIRGWSKMGRQKGSLARDFSLVFPNSDPWRRSCRGPGFWRDVSRRKWSVCESELWSLSLDQKTELLLMSISVSFRLMCSASTAVGPESLEPLFGKSGQDYLFQFLAKMGHFGPFLVIFGYFWSRLIKNVP